MRFSSRPLVLAWCCLAALAATATTALASDPLPSWNDTPAKAAIVSFVESVVDDSAETFVPVAERIAVFDNDGCLWAEQPVYFQLLFALDRVRAMAADHPQWKDEEPFKSVLADDMKAVMASGKEGLLKLVAASHSGMTTDQFAADVADWLATARHPRFDRPYDTLVYQPQLELLDYLRDNGFKTFIVSGGGADFVRVFAEEVYGIPPEQVVGTRLDATYEVRDGVPVVIKQPDVSLIDDKAGKPVGIHQHIGRRPIFAAGNSDGDFQMLEYTTAGDGPRLGMIVHHTDADREWAYDRESHVGKLNDALDQAPDRGWLVVDMAKDWATVFPEVAAANAGDAPASTEGMAYITGGTFVMGSDRPGARYDEQPAHPVTVDGFWIDRTEVTNAQFRAFVEATGYVTTAERPVDWEEMKKQLPPGTPKPPDDTLQPGSLVFNAPDHPVDLRVYTQWWAWTHGASWRHPKGPGSSIEGKDDWPVVQVSWDDANAYAQWAGKRLPTEAEWERAARYGHDGDRFTWGNQLKPDGTHMANIWQGTFPQTNSADDGFVEAAPVKSFPPNAAGLYDMAGNVWEWTADRFHPDAYRMRMAERSQPGADGSCCINPTGPNIAADPRNPYAQASYVQKGGSFLCHASYCESYRPSAKMAAPPDSGLMHLGFRCVMDAPPPND